MILGKSPNKGPVGQESMFLVCGLCSQVANESMTIDDTGLRTFLVHLFSITNEDLPSKICTDCFPEMAECKKFADRCGRAIARLKNTQIADHMILGKTPKKEVKQQATTKVKEPESAPVQKEDPPAPAATPAKQPPKPPAPPKPQVTPKPSPASKKEAKPKKPDPAGLSTDLIIDSLSGRRAARGTAAADESPAPSGRRASKGADGKI